MTESLVRIRRPTPHRRYVLVEMAVAGGISAVMSLLFALIVFGGRSLVPVAGISGLVFDALPQTALVVLMSVLAPTAITHRRIRAGAVVPSGVRMLRPRRPLVRALTAASLAMIVAGAGHALFLPQGPEFWPLEAAVAYKIGYGFLLGAASAGWAVTSALKDGSRIVCPGGVINPVRNDA